MTLTARQVRNHNRRTIYRLLLRMGRTTKTELAALSGLSVPTVLKIVAHLEERGLVRLDEEAQTPQAQGRPPQVLRFCADRACVIGARYEGDLLGAGLVNLSGRVRCLRARRVEGGFARLMRDELPALVGELMARAGAESGQLLGVSVGLPAICEPDGSAVYGERLMGRPGFVDVTDQMAALRQELGVPVMLENGAHLAAVGEYAVLKRHQEDFVYLSLGEQVSCGVIARGRLVRGEHGQCGEIGCMRMCGGRTLEELAGRGALEKRFGRIGPDNRQEIIRFVAPLLADALHNLMLGCDAQELTVGGELATKLGAGLIGALRGELDARMLGHLRVQRQVCPVPAVLGAAIQVMGMNLGAIIGED
ncbi:MAG: ROK family transcriptional regulator [Candidatus Spyradocola sp.]